MKNSDMKVIAIILSIALFFTIVTSNAVSVASVVLLALDNGTSNEATQQTAGPAQQQSTQQGTVQQQGTVADPNAGASTSTDAGNTATNNAGNAATNNAAKSPIEKDPLGAYQKAAKEINQKGSAGYNKIGWQKPIKIEGLGILDSVIVPILEGFMTTEDEAEVKQNAKGSDEAKSRMPASNCSKGAVKSATAEKLSNGNYKVVIVMKEEVNPSYQSKDGLAVMSKEFLDYADVQKEAANISVVKSLDGTITYKDYTITAEMNSKGQFVSITHYGIGYIKANLNGSINAYGELEFNAKYTDFKY